MTTYQPQPAAPVPAMPPGDSLVASGLTKIYGDQSTGTVALADVNLTIAPGAAVAVMGPSGSGKTTLLHTLAGVVRPTRGSVLWRGRDVAHARDAERSRLRRSDFGFVFQSGHLLPELPAEENIAMPLMLDGMPRGHAVARARELLEPLGLGGLGGRRPGQLSGGQAQRVAIARALAGRPGVVFADEPTGQLDSETSAEIMGHLTAVVRQAGVALVVVTHDPLVAQWCGAVVRMRDGRIEADRD